jgi:hypothetical protein
MVAMGRLRKAGFDDRDVASLWTKAVQSAHDAELPGMSLDGGLRSAYDAGHLACLAFLAYHGLKPGSGGGHHEVAFFGAAALAGTLLPDLVPEAEEIRTLRAGSMYDPELAGASDLDRALAWVRRTLPVLRELLIGAAPALGQLLDQYP